MVIAVFDIQLRNVFSTAILEDAFDINDVVIFNLQIRALYI